MVELLVKKFLSRKFLVAVGAFAIVVLDGIGLATFSNEVTTIATATLMAEIAVQGVVDAKTNLG